MSPVACPAPLLGKDRVNNLSFVLFPVVTDIAELASIPGKQVIEIRCVRVMALCTFSGLKCGMDLSLVHSNNPLAVAFEAQGIPDLLQKQLWNKSMPEMAVLAFPFLCGRVDGFFPQILFGEFLVAVQAGLLLEFPGTKGVLAPK